MSGEQDKLNEIKEQIQSDKNDGHSLDSLYRGLLSIIKTDTSLAPQMLEVYKTALQSDKNDGRSLEALYRGLLSIIKADTSLAPQVLEVCKTALQSDKNDGRSLEALYARLPLITDENASLAPPVLEIYRTASQSDKNEGSSLDSLYRGLLSIANANVPLAPQILEFCKTASQYDKNNSDSLSTLYARLSSIAEKNASLVPQVFEVYRTALQSDKNDGYSLETLYKRLSSIAEKDASLVPQVLDIYKTAAQSDKNDRDSLGSLYKRLPSIAEADTSLMPQVLEVYKNAAQSDKNDRDSLGSLYKRLPSITEADTSLAPQILEVYKNASQSDENDWDSLSELYYGLPLIVKADASLAAQVFEVYKTTLQLDENVGYYHTALYKGLSLITEADASLAPQVFEVYKTALQLDMNDCDSLAALYDGLPSIVKADASLAAQVFEVYKTDLQSGKNIRFPLVTLYYGLSSVVEADASLAAQVLDIYKIAAQSYKNYSTSLSKLYRGLSSVVKADPSLAPQVVQICLEAPHPFEKFQLLSLCFKHCRPEDIGSVTEEQKQIVQAAWNMRFSTEQERRFAFDNMEIERIAATSFSAQQRCMNVLVGCLGQEKNLPAEATAGYRKDSDNELYKDNADWLVPASFKAAELFGCYFPAYLKKTQGFFLAHDAVYWLPQGMSKAKNESFARFLQNNVVYADIDGNKKARPLAELNMIAKSWKALKPDMEKAKYKDILAFCQSQTYADQEIAKFAVEAARWGVQEGDYKNCEKIYQAGLKVPEPFDSSKEFKFGKYTGRFLPRDDVRVGFFGEYTDCCQHFGGVGNSCAVSSVMDPYSQLFVIENEKGSIIGGSWVWENTEGRYREVCFDNIEAIGEYASNPIVNKIYEQAGRYLAQEADCRRVTIGLGYQDADVSSYQNTEAIALPKQYKNKYSDARNQVLLAENPKAAPLDKSAESLRYVRDACFLDVAAMEDISERCFPEGDKGLQIPNEPSGLVLIDKDKGVVGYCLYDKEEKSVYDMAVLPEYRKDKNASSGKLFAETVREIKKLGGEWTAELRDKTTMRYMEAMGQRGLVEYQVNGVDHEMSNGDKVYSVTFKPKVIAKQAQKVQTPISNAAER